MTPIDLDKIILGHNQFFGTDHMSQERGAHKDQKFSQIDSVINLIEYSYSLGVTGLMLSTHERAKSISERIKLHPTLRDNLNIYILLPYMAKYVRAANEKGIVTMVAEILSDASWGQRMGILAKGGWGVLSKDIESILEAMIRIELLPFQGLRLKAVFLHNALTDLAVGYGLMGPLQFFMEIISKEFNTTPGFCTLNSALLLEFLSNQGVENPLVMAPFNPMGFQMNPSKNACEESLKKYPSQTIAMSVLAAGSIQPSRAVEYLQTLPEIKSVIVGYSTKEHADEAIKEFKHNFGDLSTPFASLSSLEMT